MVNISASIPDQLKDWIDIRISQGSYSSTSDYVRDLIRNDQCQKGQLDNLLEDGLSSPSFTADKTFWKNKKDKLLQKFQ